jgi:hypothetical protein
MITIAAITCAVPLLWLLWREAERTDKEIATPTQRVPAKEDDHGLPTI